MSDTTEKASSDMTPEERHVWCYVFLQMCVSAASVPGAGNVTHFSEHAADQVVRKLCERGMVEDAVRSVVVRAIAPTDCHIPVRIVGP